MPFTEEQGKISKAIKVAEGPCKMRYEASRKAIVLKHKKIDVVKASWSSMR